MDVAQAFPPVSLTGKTQPRRLCYELFKSQPVPELNSSVSICVYLVATTHLIFSVMKSLQ
jgi:hypothetical protein